jgi:hypothetical protein
MLLNEKNIFKKHKNNNNNNIKTKQTKTKQNTPLLAYLEKKT